MLNRFFQPMGSPAYNRSLFSDSMSHLSTGGFWFLLKGSHLQDAKRLVSHARLERNVAQRSASRKGAEHQVRLSFFQGFLRLNCRTAGYSKIFSDTVVPCNVDCWFNLGVKTGKYMSPNVGVNQTRANDCSSPEKVTAQYLFSINALLHLASMHSIIQQYCSDGHPPCVLCCTKL
jgi:hypothetical protein